MSRKLVLADLQFGDARSTATSELFLRRLEGLLSAGPVEEIVLAGDTTSSLRFPTAYCLELGRPLFALLRASGAKVVVLSGNHDKHLKTLRGEPSPDRTFYEQQGFEVVADDWYSLGEELIVTHGDLTIAWQLGRDIDPDFRQWYEEALLDLYRSAQHGDAAVDRVHVHAKLKRYRGDIADRLMTDHEIAEAVAAQCRADAIGPSTVILGHFHRNVEAVTHDEWTVVGTGGALLDPWLIAEAGRRAWPGNLLEVNDRKVETIGLFDDLSPAEILGRDTDWAAFAADQPSSTTHAGLRREAESGPSIQRV